MTSTLIALLTVSSINFTEPQDTTEKIQELIRKCMIAEKEARRFYEEEKYSQSKERRLLVLEYISEIKKLRYSPSFNDPTKNKLQIDIGLYDTPYALSVHWQAIAHCQLKLNNLHYALPAYRNSLYWLPSSSSLDSLWGTTTACSEYAVALAKSNKLNEAKICYYISLVRLRTTTRYNEPVPFLVVFDPDPKAEVWKFNKENLIKAAMCINAMDNGFYREEFFEKYADWDFAKQMKNAKFPGEKFTPENDPNIMRKNLQVLIKAEEDLKTNWPKICEEYVIPSKN